MGKAVKGHQGFVSEGKNIGSQVGVIGCKFPPEIDEILRSLPNRSDKIREWVIQGLVREKLLEQHPGSHITIT